jgi:hypothetical protein
MRRLGGFVRVETAEGLGTAVHLYFRPVVAAASAEMPALGECDSRGGLNEPAVMGVR